MTGAKVTIVLYWIRFIIFSALFLTIEAKTINNKNMTSTYVQNKCKTNNEQQHETMTILMY